MIEKGDILEPVSAGRLQLRNRVVMPAHTTNFGIDGNFSARHLAYHRERAAGGVGLIITEGMRVHSSSLARNNTVAAMTDKVIDSLGALADVVHAEGAKLAGQILHVGRQAGSHGLLTSPWSASAIPWNSQAPVPHVMNADEINEVVEGFAGAATRCQTAGLDAVEVHLGHGHLLQQFLSPASNHRSDKYGGSLDNRLRIVREVLDSVGSAAGSLPLILRISGDEFLDGGLGVNEMIEVMSLLLTEYTIDLLHVSHSAYVGTRSIATQIADMSFPPAPFIDIPRRFKRTFPDTAILAVCRVDDLDTAQALIDDSSADLIALARSHIAEPDLVRRHSAGLAPRRRCIACNQGCAGRLESGLPISCVVNPEVGLEATWSAVRKAADSAPSRSVLVIGAGPAGLEAAITAASVGHHVTLVEKSQLLGGALNLAAALPIRSRFAIMVSDLAAALKESGVVVRTGLEVTAEWISHHNFDYVIEATGASPAPNQSSLNLPVIELADAITKPSLLGDHVAIIDEDGGWTAVALADVALQAGAQVTFLSENPTPAWRVPIYSRPELLTRLSGARCQVSLATKLWGMENQDLVGHNVYSRTKYIFDDVRSVVFVAPRVAVPSIETKSREGGSVMGWATIGDAFAPRSALEAAYEGRLAGLTSTDTEPVRLLAESLRGLL